MRARRRPRREKNPIAGLGILPVVVGAGLVVTGVGTWLADRYLERSQGSSPTNDRNMPASPGPRPPAPVAPAPSQMTTYTPDQHADQQRSAWDQWRGTAFDYAAAHGGAGNNPDDSGLDDMTIAALAITGVSVLLLLTRR